MYLFFFFECNTVPRYLHVRTHSFPTRRSSYLVFSSAAAGTAFLSRVHCHLSRCMGAGLLAIAVLLVAEPARANQTIMASDSAQVDCQARSEEHTSELQSLMRISYAVFCLNKKNTTQNKRGNDI